MCRFRSGLVWAGILVWLVFSTACAAQPAAAPRESEAVKFKVLKFSPAANGAELCRQLFDVRAAADRYTNAVILAGSEPQVQLAIQVLDRMDGEINDADLEGDVALFPLKNANAKEIAAEFEFLAKSGAFPPSFDGEPVKASFTCDQRTNTLVVHADGKYFSRIRAIVEKLDVPVALGPSALSPPATQ